MRIGSLFSGIGGLELGLEWAGLGHTVWQVEQSEFCRGVLARHWPETARYEDVHEVGKSNLAPVDLICGGFPCQDISVAGPGTGLAGRRSGLWFEFSRVVGELEPEWVIVENVAAGGRWVDTVVLCLEKQGYGVLPVPLSASDVGCLHKRSRIFIIAHSSCKRLEKRKVPNVQTYPKPAERVRRGREAEGPEEYQDALAGTLADALVRGVVNEVPHRVDRIRAIGNAVSPACAEVIGWMVRELSGKIPS